MIIRKSTYQSMLRQLEIQEARLERQEKILRKYIDRNSHLFDLLKESEYKNTIIVDECKLYREVLEERLKLSDTNPIETRMTLFLRNNPKAKLDENGLPLTCAGDIYGFDCTNKNLGGCKKCWGEVLNNDKSM